MVIVVALLGCNRYGLFRVEDGGEGYAHDADVLFVLDNSESMRDEAVGLAENFARFVEVVAAREAAIAAIGADGLEDAVDAYVAEASFGEGFADLQLGVTTIDAGTSHGALLGYPPFLRGDDPDLVDRFAATVLCAATCFVTRDDVPTDPTHTCGAPFTSVSQEYLDCACGADEWLDHCGSAVEEGLESAYLALCRAEDEPPAACFTDGGLTEADRGTSAGFHRERASYLPIVVTDEGDQSRRLAAVQAVPAEYVGLFGAFATDVTFAVVGPTLNGELVDPCAPTVPSWGVTRYDFVAEDTGGVKLGIHAADCGPTDWAAALEQLGALVNGAARAFRLERAALPDSIAVTVGGRAVARAEVVGKDHFRRPLYTDGWSYVRDAQTVYLHGDAIPVDGEPVRIWYLPE